jgi:hypothetical protein
MPSAIERLLPSDVQRRRTQFGGNARGDLVASRRDRLRPRKSFQAERAEAEGLPALPATPLSSALVVGHYLSLSVLLEGGPNERVE